jgi:hypothetical protein
VTVNDPSSRRGFWFRYSTFDPRSGVDIDAHAALWAFAFDHEDPSSNWGAKQTFPIGALHSERNPFHLRLGDASLERDGCTGELRSDQGHARWQLKWISREPPFALLDPRFLGVSSVANIGAQPALAVTGMIEINGRGHQLDAAPGGQQHTWGSSHALEWNWGFACGPDFWVDGVSSRVRSRWGRTLGGTAVGARVGSESFLFNGVLRVLRNPGAISPHGWVASARLGDRRLDVTVKPRRADLVGVTYADPGGGKRYCYHTEVADLMLRLSRRDQGAIEVTRPAAAAFEYAAEIPLADVPLIV